jgi:hypothetical protein
MVVSGLAQDFARSHGNGGGDHARATATFLTGCMPKKTAGADIQLGVSVDQIAAQKIGHLTRLPSLELSTDGQRSAGRCDSGYSCAYQFNLAWKNETMPMAPEMGRWCPPSAPAKKHPRYRPLGGQNPPGQGQRQ